MTESQRPKSWHERKKTIKNKLSKPFIYIEWFCEWIVYFFRQMAFFEILEYVGRLAVLVAIIFWWVEREDRKKEKHYQAWQIVNAAYEKTNNAGRTDALQDLVRDNVSLADIDLQYANLLGINLEGADLTNARLDNINLSHANLSGANLSGTTLYGANLSEANLKDVNLSDTQLVNADLSGADLEQANFSGADLAQATLLGAKNWRKIKNMKNAQINNCKNYPEGFIKFAEEQGAINSHQ